MFSNQEAHNDFWWFVNERHRIYLAKESKLSKPWSEDNIFQSWRFCNVFRQIDTQSKWLIENVLNQHRYDDPSLILFNIFVFRAFNWHPTYEWLSYGFTGKLWLDIWSAIIAQHSLKAFLDDFSSQLTSGAYMIRGSLGQHKWQSIPNTLDEIWKHRNNLTKEILKGNTLQHAWQEILDAKYWGWGPFTSYQVVLDLTYTSLFSKAPDINDWCTFGPGAMRGLKEIWPELPLKQEWMLEAAKSLLADQVKYREPHVPELNLQDIEFCLCELARYRKIKRGGKGKVSYNGT